MKDFKCFEGQPERGFVTPKEAAVFLGLSRSMIYNLMGGGHLEFKKFGRARRISKASLLKLADGGTEDS